MKPNINILIVEDDPNQIQSYLDTIEIYNEEEKTNIIPESVESLESALEKMSLNNYDAAIVDLKLSKSTTEFAGNIIAKEIISNLRFPLFILTGNKADVDVDLVEQKNTFFDFYNKGEIEVKEILNSIVKTHNTGITQILNRQGPIEKYLTKIFRENIVLSMPYWIDKANTENTYDPLLRYTMSHLQEFLEISDNGNYQNYHIPEIYIKNPIKISDSTVYTGDIVIDLGSNTHYFIISPSCDLATDKGRSPKVEFVTLIKIDGLDKLPINGDKAKNVKNNKEYAYHYLPPIDNIFHGGLIHFQQIRSVKISDIINKELYHVSLCISNAFKKDIIARFSNYYSRQGQPTFD